MEKKIIWIFLFIGSTIGSFIPLLWGEDMASLSSILFTGIGGFIGIWIGFKMTR